ncbi:Ldh family oxidoreductase [Actinoplanes subtropicus]|uniref:Ldh family oxidoreductase n=1 Tax=Actinoplanes subtropicus TaxID=543632 RepID=UPI0004C395DF|nr:Ldh family oxidoreductase [Actinoplanes subtropicus]
MPVVIPAADLAEFVTALFTEVVPDPGRARTISDVLVWASLRGVDSHGVARVPRYLELLASGEANANARMRFTAGAAGVAVLDADRAPGPVALTAAADEAVSRGRSRGIGAVGVRRTVHTGAIGYYTSRIADAGLIGIAFVAGMPNMSYPGVTGVAVATSPLSIAVPATGDRPAVLLDMATAGIALGKIAQYRNNGRQLPEGVAATADGTATTDPALATMPLPLGGAKGAGMSLAFELLTSVLVGAPILSSFHGADPGGRAHRQNALLVVLDPAAFGDPATFTASVTETLDTLHGLPSADPAAAIRYPGEHSAAAAEERAANGVPVNPKVWAELQAAAEQLGVALPAKA